MAKNRYSDKDICKNVREIMDGLGLDRFPTYREMQNYTGSTQFTQLVSRRGGSSYFSEMMGVEWKNNYTFGTGYEPVAMTDIKEETGLDCYFAKNQHPYDICAANGIKVDVKVAKPNKENFHEFAIHKKDPTCDVFLCYLLDESGSVLDRLVIPSCVVQGKQCITVRANGKWKAYSERWDYFEQYKGFFESLQNNA